MHCEHDSRRVTRCLSHLFHVEAFSHAVCVCLAALTLCKQKGPLRANTAQ